MRRQRRPIRLLMREHGISGGAETVNIHLVREFTKLVDRVVWVVPDWRMTFFQQILPPSERLIYQPPYWPPQARLQYFLRKTTSYVLRRKGLPARLAFENLRRALVDLWLKRVIRDHGITHCFCNWTFHVDVPRIGIPLGTMLMDVRWKRFPESFPHTDIESVDRNFSDWLRESSVVFPVSETTASDIKRFYPWHTGRMVTVPHGADPGGHQKLSREATHPLRNNRPVFFCPGGANGHKNHLTLFRACAELFVNGFDFDVVLTGLGTECFERTNLHGKYPPTGEAVVEHARMFLREHDDLFDGRIYPRGYIDREQIESLYQNCSAVILPSFFEGFGLPLVEALQNGAAVICSDIPAHREQLVRYNCADRVTSVPPMDHISLANAMEKTLVERRANKPHIPPNTLNQWTWNDAAEAYLDALSAVRPNDSQIFEPSRILS